MGSFPTEQGLSIITCTGIRGLRTSDAPGEGRPGRVPSGAPSRSPRPPGRFALTVILVGDTAGSRAAATVLPLV